MNKLSHYAVAAAIGGAALIASTYADAYAKPSPFKMLDDSGLIAMTQSEMSAIRGGFSAEGSLISIGLSIITALNGEEILRSHIANFTISNGVLTTTAGSAYASGDMINLKQVGNGNTFERPELLPNSIMQVVQNTVEGSHIRIERNIDINADINSYLQNSVLKSRLENSLLHTGY
ncbi:hypothetical protein L4174_020650 [Photobacterium sp. CCB-ST2H9]|uniref:hypothetical protein n=1 Tax=unclassified Photobacterium TaxID=2628852 RepID=UPI0020032B32|nr:hypothetical protein [Photobacterium sp. CCB-ST2H9]UTM59124.1 hypothetical protein L4174_020650 [Photobacterium sp. CCB-ST2H9]